MKKVNVLANILICSSLGLWAMRALFSYINYTRHVALFADKGWFWYTDVFTWGKFVIPIVIVCLALKAILRKK